MTKEQTLASMAKKPFDEFAFDMKGCLSRRSATSCLSACARQS
jgi:hypothetical protein